MALHIRVAQVGDHTSCVASIWLFNIAGSRLERLHGGDQHEGEDDEGPHHRVENIEIGHNTVTKLRDGVLLHGLFILVLLDDRCFPFVDLTAINVDRLAAVASEKVVHFTLPILLQLFIAHLRQAPQN